MFQRLVHQLQPTAVRRQLGLVDRTLEAVGPYLIIALPALFHTLVLAGEEIPDLLQKRASEHPETDPFLRDVNRYHRQEEARHLSYARAVLAEVWAEAGPADRFAVRHIAPRIIGSMFNLLVHPGVYEAAGLPGWETWKQVRNSPKRVAFRQEATRPVLDALLAAGVFQPGRVPSVWCRLTGYRG